MFDQTTLFNDAAYENHQSIYMKWQQVKVEWGISVERERETDRADTEE